MKFFYLLSFLILIIIALPLLSAAHYILGIANNALDGTNANDRMVVLWGAASGISDNLTDVIGANGNSGVPNTYMIDCELLNSGCDIGNEIKIKVLNSGDKYISNEVNLSVTGAGYDVAPNITLNSPPNSTLNSPINYANFSSGIFFNCSGFDLDGNLANISLYGNWSGGWHKNDTLNINGSLGYAIFLKNLTEGRYLWNCFVGDNWSIGNFYPQNFTLTVDKTSPIISSVYSNESYFCGNHSYARVNCTVFDSMTSISAVIIEANNPSGKFNYSASLLFGQTYYSDILLNQTGSWFFNCIANDSAGNQINLSSSNINIYSDLPDLFINFSSISFSNLAPMENQGIIINATISNLGCYDANNFLVGFYEGDPETNGIQINGNKTLSVSARSNETVNVSWNVKIGTTDIFVFADLNYSISEPNESNNKAYKTLNITAWQEFYGKINSTKVLSDALFSNLTLWENHSNIQGNIFITDTEAQVDWFSLQAIGRNKSGGTTNNDFLDIDSLLNMSDFQDSVYNTFTNFGAPKATTQFLVHQKIIENVPIINSTNTSSFITGILWDYSDDFDGEFSQNDSEDLIFVAKINYQETGAYGCYDYEIKIPVCLRNYDPLDSSEVYLYYDLI